MQQSCMGIKVNLHKLYTAAPGRSKWSASRRQNACGKIEKQRKSQAEKLIFRMTMTEEMYDI
jgi:hypothetical protein